MQYLLSIIAALLISPALFHAAFSQPNVGAQPALTTFQGGTGSTSPSGVLYGDGSIGLKTLTPGANCTFVAGTFNCSGGAASAGGSNTQVQFNDAGSLAGSANFVFDKTSNIVTLLLASTTRLSAYQAAFGGSATSTFATNGALTLATQLTVPNGGTGQVSFTAGNLIYGGGAGALQNVATSTLTPSSPLTGSFTVVGSGGSLGLDTSGTWSGNAGTASALTANGANCGGGYFPLGVSAAGVSENCTQALATTTSWTGGQAAYVTGSGALIGLSTTTQTFSGPFSLSATQGYLLGGSSATITYYGLATTSALTAGQLLMSNGGAGVSSTATTTATCSGTVSCSTFNILGSSPVTITGSASGATVGTVSTSSTPTRGQLSYWTSSGAYPETLGSVATTTLTFSGPLSTTANLGSLVGGANGTITWSGLATTSALTGGQLLTSNGGAGVSGVATTTITYSGFPATIPAGYGTLVGGSNTTFTWWGLATSSNLTAGQVLMSNGAGNVSGVATSSLGVTGPITFSGTMGAQLGGVGGSFGCATCALTTRALTIAGTANQITSSAGSQDLSADRTWTLSLPSHVIFPVDYVATNATTTNATTTTLYFTGLTSGALAVDATGKVYKGATTTAGADLTYDGTAFNVDTLPNLTGTLDIDSGGTNATTFGSNSPIVFDGTRLTATSTRGIFDYIVATTTATSTFAGGLKTAALQDAGLSAVNCDVKAYTDGSIYCGTDATGGAATAGGSDTQVQFNDGGTAIGGAVGFVWDKVKSLVGIGSTTPWGILSIASSTYNYRSPLFAVGTSSGIYGKILTLFATSSTMMANTTVLGSGGTIPADSGVRLGLGTDNTYGYPGMLDQLTINGRINTLDWRSIQCVAHSTIGSPSSDTANACGEFTFQNDTSGNDVATNAGGILYEEICTRGLQPCSADTGAAVANNGAGLFAMSPNFIFATSTPIIEAVARIGLPSVATSSYYYIGFVNISPTGSAFELEPTAGCYFVASTTLANWQAQCRTSLTNTTTVDTGFASTTNPINTGSFARFRIEADVSGARFYMATSSKALQQVATIQSNFPTTTALSVGAYEANLVGGNAKRFDINSIKLWFSQPALNF